MALNANKADRLSNTSKIGDTDKPVYFTADGTPTAISYTIAKSVPSTAVFTDTTYTFAGGTNSFTVTPAGGTAQTVSITPSIDTSLFVTRSSTSTSAGSSTKPVYINSSGVATALNYTIEKSVPSTAVFTDTWNAMTGATSSTSGTVGYINAVPPKTGYNTKFWRADGTWAEPAGSYTYTLPTASSSTLGGIKVNGNGLTVDSSVLKHSNSITAKTAYGSTATAVNANGGTFTVTDIKYDANGHITASTDRTITISQEDKKVLQANSESTAWRKVILGSTSASNVYEQVTTATDQVFQSRGVEVQPYNGVLRAIGLRAAGSGTSAAIRLYSNEVEIGTWKSTATGTTAATGWSHLYIANDTGEGTDNNSRGALSIYGKDSARHILCSSITGSTNQYVYIQNYAGTQYLVHASSTAAVGSSSQPVYVAANGRITAVDSSYVKTSGDTMTGTLTLSSGNVRVETGNMALRLVGYTRGTTASAAVDRSFSFYDDNYNRLVGRMQCAVDTSGVNKVYMMVYKNNATAASAAFYIQYDSTTSSAGCNAAEFRGNKVYGAVYNDYAEFRETEEAIEAGRCVYEQGNGKLALSEKRLMRGCELVSDTYGFAIGQSEKAQTPIAVTGRVLAYCLEGQEAAKKFIGYPVCSGPNGTVSIMTEEEEAKYPSRIIGTISEIPNYDQWQCGDKDNSSAVNVNNRIWIRVR